MRLASSYRASRSRCFFKAFSRRFHSFFAFSASRSSSLRWARASFASVAARRRSADRLAAAITASWFSVRRRAASMRRSSSRKAEMAALSPRTACAGADVGRSGARRRFGVA